MDRDNNVSTSFILSIICILFIVFTIVFISTISLTKNGLVKDREAYVVDKDNNIYGDNLHGYVELSPLWNEIRSKDSNDNSLYFKSRDGYLLTMSAFDSSETSAYDLSNTLFKKINNSDYSGVSFTNEKIGEYVSYKVVGYNLKVNKWLYTWTFEDNGVTHFISIEGREKDSSHFKIPTTFKNNR